MVMVAILTDTSWDFAEGERAVNDNFTVHLTYIAQIVASK